MVILLTLFAGGIAWRFVATDTDGIYIVGITMATYCTIYLEELWRTPRAAVIVAAVVGTVAGFVGHIDLQQPRASPGWHARP